MTEPQGKRVYSQDYWDIVLSQLRRRPLAIGSLLFLIVLYAAAIYAPFIANGRPLYFEGIDLGSYRRALRELELVSHQLVEEAKAAARGDEKASQLLGREVEAISIRVATMRLQLSDADSEPLDELAALVREATERAQAGEASAVDESGERILALSGRIGETMSPRAPGEPPRPGTVELTPYRAWPALATLTRGEIFFMTLWAVILTWPLWNRAVNRSLGGNPLHIRHARRMKALGFFLIPAAATAVWSGKGDVFFVSAYKEGLTRGDVIAERVVFAPVPFGIAETNEGETFRPPTWEIESEISEEGYYVYGPRAGRFDATTGLPKAAQPVAVREGEPGRNDGLRHPLGTDSLGRDLLARLIWGGRVSLAVGLVSTVVLVLIGTVLGSVAGYYGGWVDTAISRVIEVVQTFPVFFLILIVVAFVGPSIMNIMLIIGLVRWTGVARLVRGEFIRLRGQDFVIASEALGVRNLRTIFRHILPNAMGPVLVAGTFSVASGILTESALSFLGFGIQLPIPSWGSLLIESRSAEHWWIQVYPGLLIFITVFLYNLFGEGVRDALDPRLKVT